MNELHQHLLGTWTVVRAELGGAPMPPEAAARVEIEFDVAGNDNAWPMGEAGGAYRVRFAGETSDSGHFQLFAQTETALHQRITLHGKIGSNAGRTLPGIIRLRGDRLKLCLALEGDAPPTAFSSSDPARGVPYYLVTYKRKTR